MTKRFSLDLILKKLPFGLFLPFIFIFFDTKSLEKMYNNIQNGVKSRRYSASSCQKAINSNEGSLSFGERHVFDVSLDIC